MPLSHKPLLYYNSNNTSQYYPTHSNLSMVTGAISRLIVRQDKYSARPAGRIANISILMAFATHVANLIMVEQD